LPQTQPVADLSDGELRVACNREGHDPRRASLPDLQGEDRLALLARRQRVRHLGPRVAHPPVGRTQLGRQAIQELGGVLRPAVGKLEGLSKRLGSQHRVAIELYSVDVLPGREVEGHLHPAALRVGRDRLDVCEPPRGVEPLDRAPHVTPGERRPAAHGDELGEPLRRRSGREPKLDLAHDRRRQVRLPCHRRRVGFLPWSARRGPFRRIRRLVGLRGDRAGRERKEGEEDGRAEKGRGSRTSAGLPGHLSLRERTASEARQERAPGTSLVAAPKPASSLPVPLPWEEGTLVHRFHGTGNQLSSHRSFRSSPRSPKE
jgi:hypothetical protein